MTEQNARNFPAPPGDDWIVMADDGFIDLVGPVWQRTVEGGLQFAFGSQAKHRNLRGVTQGGMLMTFADRAMGMAARFVTGELPQATVQLNYQFLDAVKTGDIVIGNCTILRRTKSLVFVDARLMVGDRCVGAAQGVWKILAPTQDRGRVR